MIDKKLKKDRQSKNTKKLAENTSHDFQNFMEYDTIRDIWQCYVDIQERIIRQRCNPISIVSDSIKIMDNTLFVKVDESDKKRLIDDILKEKLGVEKYDLECDSILVDEKKWNTLKETELFKIRKTLSENYIELDTTPGINVTIDYGSDITRLDQLSLDELHRLESTINKRNYIEGTIDDIAAFISTVSVQKEEYLKYLFGNHYITFSNKRRIKKNGELEVDERFDYENSFIPLKFYNQYANIGLVCNYYILEFKVKNSYAENELKDIYDTWRSESGAFEFKRLFTKEDPFHKNFLREINENIKLFLEDATLFCSENDINIMVLFSYSISKRKLVKEKMKEVAAYLKGREEYSFNEEKGEIGIDFKWREQNIETLIREIEDNVPFVKINVFDNHRFKCKVNTQLVGFDKIKQKFEDRYESISVINDSIYQQIKICLPYEDCEHYNFLCDCLKNDISQVIGSGFKVEFASHEKGKIRLNINYNENSRLEDIKDNIKDMRRANFGFMLDDNEITFGKLIKEDYPELIFDIDVDDNQKEKIISAFKSGAINSIIPILTGDLEKISRLKKTFTKAIKGHDLVNPHLQQFMFDSSQATKIDDVDLLLRKDGYVYNELSENLLNTNINESQKHAIIKAMFAEDLAVIQGPPGTGKSTAIAELIWQLIRKGMQLSNEREIILLTSETNLAVDNAISRIVNSKTNLVKPVRFGGEEKLESEGLQFSIELMKRWVEEGDSCLKNDEIDEESGKSISLNLIFKNWLDNIASRSFCGENDDNPIIKRWHRYLQTPNKDLRKIIYERYIDNANVIGATCSSIGDEKAGNADFNGFTSFYHNYCEVFKKKKGKARIEFTTVIQDESSKATPAELVLPFVYGKRAVVIGDHRQLPPMLDKEEFDESFEYSYRYVKTDEEREKLSSLQKYVNNHFDELEVSHFQRLFERVDKSLKATFNLQYRMHPDINQIIEQFYQEDGGLKCGLVVPNDMGVNDCDVNNPASRYHGININGLVEHNTHVLFINSTSPEMLDGTSRVNYGEIETINRLLTRFEKSSTFQQYLDKFQKEEDRQIGIISFYGKQIKQLRNIARLHPNLPIRVSTVDRFQGMERNIVIVSMVRSNIIQSFKDQQPDRKHYPKYGFPNQKSLGFAQSPNRLNVALSRAKRLLVIVGNKELFSQLDIYQRLFMTIESNKNNIIISQSEV